MGGNFVRCLSSIVGTGVDNLEGAVVRDGTEEGLRNRMVGNIIDDGGMVGVRSCGVQCLVCLGPGSCVPK